MWYRTTREHETHYTPDVSSLSFRDEPVTSAPAEVRRCRFIDPPAALPPIRLVGDIRDPALPAAAPDIAPVVEERGRVDDAASFGSDEPPLREALWGVPDARFLRRKSD